MYFSSTELIYTLQDQASVADKSQKATSALTADSRNPKTAAGLLSRCLRAYVIFHSRNLLPLSVSDSI